MPIQLNSTERQFIKNLLLAHLPQARLLVFGSRVRNEAKRYSDLDIAIDSGEPVPLVILSELEEKFAESDIPFKVDLIDFQRVSEEFQQRILNEYEDL